MKKMISKADKRLEELGSPGYYQYMVLVLMAAASAGVNFQVIQPVFIGGRNVKFFCKENITSNQPQSLEMMCTPKQNFTTPLRKSKGVLPPMCFSKLSIDNSSSNRSKLCTEFDYCEKDSVSATLVVKYNLVCNRRYLFFVALSVFMLGTLLGAPLFGFIADHRGRVVAYATAFSEMTAAAAVATFAPSALWYLGARFCAGLGAGGAIILLSTIVSESSTPRLRLSFGMGLGVGWNIGQLLLVAMAFALRGNRLYLLQPFCVILTGVCTVFVFCTRESLRWTMKKSGENISDKHRQELQEKTEVLCKYIGQINGVRGKPVTETEEESEQIETEKPAMKESSICDICKSRILASATSVLMLSYFTASVVYYVLIFSASHLFGSPYVFIAAGAAVALPLKFVLAALGPRLSRPKTLCLLLLCVGVVCFGCLPVYQKSELNTVLLLLTLMARFCLDSCFTFLLMYSTEVFPTSVRGTALGCCSSAARVGGILAPQLLLLQTWWGPAPFVVCGVLALTTSILGILTLPETKGKPTLECVQDAHRILVNQIQRHTESV